ncbi:MAG TPA: multiprotein bridging factor aMBF1 [Candidatus Bathyarchaeia archaeon]
MRCEVCGREIYGQPYYRVIEGGKMTVCSQCAQFGSKDWDPKEKQVTQTRRRPARSAAPQRPRNDIEAAETMELVDNYGELIRRARQRKGLTVEDFAKKLNEKESVVKKLEQEGLNPSMSLIRKVESELGIKLLEMSSTATGAVLTKPLGPRTLGDMIKINVPKDEEEEEKP